MKKAWIGSWFHYFAAPPGIIELGNDHQWQLISQKEKQQNITCLSMKIQRKTGKTNNPIK